MSLSARVDGLAQSAAELAQHEKAVIQQGRRLKRQLRQQQHREQQKHTDLQKVLFTLYVLCCPCTDAAEAFWLERMCPSPPLPAEDLRRKLEEQYLATDIQLVYKIQQGEGGDEYPVRLHRMAAKFLQEFRLRQWVQEQNTDKGVAPDTGMVLDQVVAAANDSCEASHAKWTWAPGSTAASVKWVQRFRSRWSLTISGNRVHTIVPLETMRAKVRRSKRGTLGLPKMGPWGRPASQNRGHNTVPIWGPPNQNTNSGGPIFRPPFFPGGCVFAPFQDAKNDGPRVLCLSL